MSDLETVRVALTRDQVAELDEAVAAGEYTSASAIVRDALAAWRSARAERRRDIATARLMWDQGEASGPAEPLDFDELRRESHASLAAAAQGTGNGLVG